MGTAPLRFWLLPSAVLCFPIALTVYLLPQALLSSTPDRAVVWFGYRRLVPFVTTVTLAAWWAMWDSRASEFVRMQRGGRWTFWVPPVLALGVSLIVGYGVNRRLLKLRWTFAHLVRLTWWKVASLSLPILMIAVGTDEILDRRTVRGILWIAAAGLTNLVGTGFLRSAEGMKLRGVKSGKLRNRALMMARRMRVTLRRFYIIPEGKGHLTNACGGPFGVALTDNVGKYLTGPQIDCVIAHELAHLKHNDSVKQRVWAIAVFSAMTALLVLCRSFCSSFKTVSDFAVVFVPLLIVYFLSRRCEYRADRDGCQATRDPESMVSALVGLCASDGIPANYDRFTELFQTHPSLHRRARAIAKREGICAGRLKKLLEGTLAAER